MSFSKVDFKQFSFNNFITLRDVDFVTPLVAFSRAFEDIDPIKAGSVHIRIPQGFEINAALQAEDLTPLFGALLQAKTKPFNAIAFVGCIGREEIQSIFTVTEVDDVCDEYQEQAVRLMTAALVNFVGRGALPGASPQSSNLALPRFVTQTIKVFGAATEGELKSLLMDFDTKHVNMTGFFKAENLENFNALLANRFAIGVAGHKPLSVAADLHGRMVDLSKSTKKEAALVSLLIQKYQECHNGMYVSLHPYVQTVGQKYKGFYPQCLRAIYMCLTGSHDQKIEIMKNHPALRSDNLVKTGMLNKVGPNIESWNLTELAMDIGEAMKFSAHSDEVEKSDMVKSFGSTKPKEVEKKEIPALKLEEDSEAEEEGGSGLMSVKK